MPNAVPMRRPAALLLALALALPAVGSARADDDDQDRAREAYEHHEILPLSAILPKVEKAYGRDVVNIEYEEAHGRHIYEFEIIDASGQVIEVQVDAATGKVIGNERETD